MFYAIKKFRYIIRYNEYQCMAEYKAKNNVGFTKMTYQIQKIFSKLCYLLKSDSDIQINYLPTYVCTYALLCMLAVKWSKEF